MKKYIKKVMLASCLFFIINTIFAVKRGNNKSISVKTCRIPMATKKHRQFIKQQNNERNQGLTRSS